MNYQISTSKTEQLNEIGRNRILRHQKKNRNKRIARIVKECLWYAFILFVAYLIVCYIDIMITADKEIIARTVQEKHSWNLLSNLIARYFAVR